MIPGPERKHSLSVMSAVNIHGGYFQTRSRARIYLGLIYRQRRDAFYRRYYATRSTTTLYRLQLTRPGAQQENGTGTTLAGIN
jgi:hypothetical protein